MNISERAMPLVLLCLAALFVLVPTASAQDGAPGVALGRVKARLDQAPGRPLTPSGPLELRPVFKSTVERHPFVLTLEQDLHKTFDLNDMQRQSAEWSAKCCGLDLGALFRSVDHALDERRVRKTREQIARELALLEAAKPLSSTVK